MTDLLQPRQFDNPREAGRIGPHRESHEPRLMLSNFRGTAMTAPPTWDGTHGFTQWGMDGNDQYGCCGPAATDHYNVAAAASLAVINTLGQPKYAGVLPTYFAYGIAQGEPGPLPDQGVDNQSWCAWLYQQGLIEGYGEVPLDQLKEYAVAFGGLLMGVQLSQNAQAQFTASPRIPWGQPGDTPDPELGHDILFILYDADGTAGIITWGGVQPVTAEFLAQFVTDAWAIFDMDTAKEAGFDAAAIQAALTEIHGVVTVTPAPKPAPTPVPPSPTFISKVEAWAQKELDDLRAVEKEIIAGVASIGGHVE